MRTIRASAALLAYGLATSGDAAPRACVAALSAENRRESSQQGMSLPRAPTLRSSSYKCADLI